jgi:hypothetical protein
MRAMSRAVSIAAAALLLASCRTTPPLKAISTREEIMHHMVIPNAEVVWDSVGTVYTVGHVQEIRPRTDDEWLAVEASSTILTEAGNLLMMEGRALDSGPWIKHATALRTAAASVHEAAKARNAELVFERGGNLFDACQACHFEYRFKKDPNTIRSH